jgi:hypothetical protein
MNPQTALTPRVTTKHEILPKPPWEKGGAGGISWELSSRGGTLNDENKGCSFALSTFNFQRIFSAIVMFSGHP